MLKPISPQLRFIPARRAAGHSPIAEPKSGLDQVSISGCGSLLSRTFKGLQILALATAVAVSTLVAGPGTAQAVETANPAPQMTLQHHSDGSRSMRLGDFIYHQDGSVSKRVGDFVIKDGKIESVKRGQTTIHQDGTFSIDHGGIISHQNGGFVIQNPSGQ